MAQSVLTELIAERGVLLVDGATGTQLMAAGLEAGDAPERLNLDRPEAVYGLHESYVNAGSDIVLTNTFGGSAFRLKLHKLDDRVVEINREAARHARHVVDQLERRVLVAGSMGPTGELLAPLGALEPAVAAAGFADQAKGLTEGGADVLWIETMSSMEEIEAAIEGARSASDLPIAVTLSFDTAGRTMMGVDGATAGRRLAELQVDAIGANCGNNLVDTEAAVDQMVAVAGDIPVICKANAGIPQWRGAELVYSGTPDVAAAHADRVRNRGATIIGGCCGNEPVHLARMRAVLDGTIPVPEVDHVVPEPAGPVTVDAPRGRRGGRRRR
ncbi:MAG: betaine--homocysteine S-methyltransferase [Actinomycetota bacterium]